VGFIFQFYNLIPALNALENVALSSLAQGQTRRQALARAADILAQVGLQNRLQHKPAELSGGEQQRVAIARSIAGNARLLLADEPTGDLDAASAESVMALLTDLNHRLGVTLVVATHNPAFSGLANPLYQLKMGELSAPLS